MNKLTLSLTATLLLSSSVALATTFQITNNSVEGYAFKPYYTTFSGVSLTIAPNTTKSFTSTAAVPIAAGMVIGTTSSAPYTPITVCTYKAPAGGVGAQISVSKLTRSCTSGR